MLLNSKKSKVPGTFGRTFLFRVAHVVFVLTIPKYSLYQRSDGFAVCLPFTLN